jgi:uncharacterized membrane protein
MSLKRQLLDVALAHQLSGSERTDLFRQAGLLQSPPALGARLARTYVVAALFLAALALICWMAANWNGWSRVLRVGVLEASLLASAALAWSLARSRVPFQVLLFFAIGVLFAGLGQIYQSGRDPWQLFALWAALGLPLVLVARSNALWIPWVTVVFLALLLERGIQLGWREPDAVVRWLVSLSLTVVLLQGLRPRWQRWSGTDRWPLRWAALLLLLHPSVVLGLEGGTFLLVALVLVPLLVQEWMRGGEADLVYFAVLLFSTCTAVNLSIYREVLDMRWSSILPPLFMTALLTLSVLALAVLAMRSLAHASVTGGAK